MDQEAQKKAIYERLSTRRRKYVDRIGYDRWDPFQEPKDPIDIRREVTRRSAQDLARDFFAACTAEDQNAAYTNGVREMCKGIVASEDRCRGMYDFALWYHEQIKAMGLEKEMWER
ncbi:hypothetical protein [Desulfohalobium retbaense]|uniref:Uncharacterized protein n=1 Tax=Desulfohalobium retbaense (strain ATCC 49708 / DSM 5692 / JCM 16813 / HR100) TaxID=485915 RepID=C8WZR9_DESRD|nr:hypothetical protein [Desulfohalobium retbaense]ACV67544.1 conserved hypothetical protein [Desulfohalobium retbaense DSM 5692]